MDRCFTARWLRFDNLDSKQAQVRSAGGRALGTVQGKPSKADFDGGGTRLTVGLATDVDLHKCLDGLGTDSRKDLLPIEGETASRCCPHNEVQPALAQFVQKLIDVALSVGNNNRLGQLRLRVDIRQTGYPFVAFLFPKGSLMTACSLSNCHVRACPDLLPQQTQRQPRLT